MKKKGPVETETTPIRPGLTPGAREKQLIALAYDLVEERLRNGTATSQETTHFLRMGSPKARTEQEILELQKEHIKAKISAIKASEVTESLVAEALKAFSLYSGKTYVEDTDL